MISTLNELTAEALFVSDLQPSQSPDAELVQSSVTAMVLRYGSDGCAALVAAEFGDHPETAVRRMRWARELLVATASGARELQPAG